MLRFEYETRSVDKRSTINIIPATRFVLLVISSSFITATGFGYSQAILISFIISVDYGSEVWKSESDTLFGDV